MSYNKKIFSYSSKKEVRETKSWTGALKDGDALNSTATKSLLKKSVWASVPRKSVEKSISKAKFEDGDDPFDFVEDETVFSPSPRKSKTKSTTGFYGSPLKPKSEKKTPTKEQKSFTSPNKANNVNKKTKKLCTKEEIDGKCINSEVKVNTKPKSLEPKSQKNVKDRISSPSKGKTSVLSSVSQTSRRKATTPKSIDMEIKRLNGQILEEVKSMMAETELRELTESECDGGEDGSDSDVPVQFIDDNSILVIRHEPGKPSKKKCRNTPTKKSRQKEEKEELDEALSAKCLVSSQPSSERLAASSSSKEVPCVNESSSPTNSLNEDSQDESSLTEADQKIQDMLNELSPKRISTKKRSLFQCYDKSEEQDNEIDKDLTNKNIVEKLNISDVSPDFHDDTSVFQPLTKKNKYGSEPSSSQDSSCFLQESQSSQNTSEGDFNASQHTSSQLSNHHHTSQQHTSSQGSSHGDSSKCMKSPFKAKKSLSQRYNDRRLSSLPTNVTLENTDIDDTDLQVQPKTPPPLYRSSIFGFRSSASSHKVRVNRAEKELHIIVRNTKNAHECLDEGQTQLFKDDLEYLMDGLKSSHKIATRCHSALELASKCTSVEFRMHIKAHGLTESIFTALEDAFIEEQLLLCACMILFVLAKDKLKLNFGKKTISFMLQVITKKRDGSSQPPNDKIRKKMKTVFQKPEYDDIDIESIDATVLAREALLSVTVKRTGDWFKDEIRELGGLDDISDMFYACGQCLQKQKDVDKNSSRMKQYLALLSDTTYRNTMNQTYLLTCRNSIVIESCIRTIYSITSNNGVKVPKTMADCLMAIQLFLMNLSHENTNACIRVCNQEHALESLMASALHVSLYLPEDMAYENTIVGLCLLINLIAHHPENRLLLNKKVTKGYTGIHSAVAPKSQRSVGIRIQPIEALMQMFLVHSEACKEADLMQELEKLEQEETELDAKMHYEEDEDGLTCGDKFEDTVDESSPSGSKNRNIEGPLNETEKRDIRSTLEKAQRHMEDSHLSAYAALLIGLLMEEEKENQQLVHSLLPAGDFSMLHDSIQKILTFMEMTNPLSKNDQDCMKRILLVISSCNEEFGAKGTS